MASSLSTVVGAIDPSRVPAALLILVAGWVATRVIRWLVAAWSAGAARGGVAVQQGGAVAILLVLGISVVLAAGTVLDLSSETALGVGGLVLIAVVYGGKNLLESLVAGITLVSDRTFAVGDRVTFHDKYGVVTDIGLRSVRVRTLDDELVVIPNSLFLDEAVDCANETGSLEQLRVVEFWIEATEDIDRACRIVFEAGATSRSTRLGRLVDVEVEDQLLNEAGLVTVHLRLKVYVRDDLVSDVATDVTTRVHKAFHEVGIRLLGTPPPSPGSG